MNYQEKIAASLERVVGSQHPSDGNVIQSSKMLRADRQLLVKAGWLQPVIRGWYMVVHPGVSRGESSIWYANFWKFLSAYLNHHFGNQYCLSAESSIDLHTGQTGIPQKVIVIVSRGGSLSIDLPFQTSILPYKDPKNIPKEKIETGGVQVMELAYALCRVTPAFFEKDPRRAEIALRLIRSADQLLEPIIEHGFKRAAARLVGAYQFLGDQLMVKKLLTGLEEVGVRLQPENPFKSAKATTQKRTKSPYSARIMSMWEGFREEIISLFPAPPGITSKKQVYFDHIEEVYKLDAYNSLSIEGFEVDPSLIEKIRKNHWSLQQQDKDLKNTLAARGYFDAFEEVKKSIANILDGANPGEVLEADLSRWYQKLFSSSVQAGLLKSTDVLGYRKSQVYIRNSRHIPLSKEALLDAMEAFFSCLQQENHAAVRAVLGHFIFVYIYPYMDGNGRIGRLIMNAMLASGGYPWTIVHVKNREEYLLSLEKASVDQDISLFVRFLASEMNSSEFHTIRGK